VACLFFGSHYNYGNLYISFSVVIPTLDADMKAKLLDVFSEENELIKKQSNKAEEKIKNYQRKKNFTL